MPCAGSVHPVVSHSQGDEHWVMPFHGFDMWVVWVRFLPGLTGTDWDAQAEAHSVCQG